MGIYTSKALTVVKEEGLAKEYSKVPNYFQTNMFYGHAQVLVDAKDDAEAKVLERLALGDFMTFKEQVERSGNIIKESEATKVVIHTDEDGTTKIDVLDDTGAPVEHKEIEPAKTVDPEDMVQQQVEGDEPVVDTSTEAPDQLPTDLGIVAAPQEEPDGGAVEVGTEVPVPTPSDTVVGSEEPVAADAPQEPEEAPAVEEEPVVITQEEINHEELENKTNNVLSKDEEEVEVRAESYIVKDGRLHKTGYNTFKGTKFKGYKR